MSDAEKVVKALREMTRQIECSGYEIVWIGALADFVEASVALKDRAALVYSGASEDECLPDFYLRVDRALARLAEVLDA